MPPTFNNLNRLSAHKIRSWCEFGNNPGVPEELVSWSATYELNAIPHATLMFPVGRRVPDHEPAVMHKIGDKFDITGIEESSIKIFIEVETSAQPPNREVWPPGPILVFEGYVVGMGFSRTRGKAHLVMHARGWLTDLAYSSCLSAQSHPANPADFLMSANHVPGSKFNANAASAVSYFPTYIDHFMYPSVLKQDFWLGTGTVPGPQGPQAPAPPSVAGASGGLHDWFMRIADVDFMDVERLAGAGLAGGVKKNAAMRRALARMKGGRCYVPLKLDVNASGYGQVSAGISNSLTVLTFKSFASNTVWNKLVTEFCPAYMMAIVPLVEIAYPIPYAPGIRQCYTTILTTEYAAIDISSQMERLLRAVCVVGARGTNTSFNKNYGDKPGLALGGFYSPPDIDEGLVLFKKVPQWLNEITVASVYAPGTVQRNKVVANAIDPGIGAPPTEPNPFTLRPVQVDLMNKYAKSFYVYEMLRRRTGALSGKFRLDIAPGSVVKVEGPKEKFVRDDALGNDFYATVIGVTIAVDAQSAIAGTSFQLAHVRNEKENKKEGFSIQTPPLWKDPWIGCSLVKELVPGNPPKLGCPAPVGPQGAGPQGGPQGGTITTTGGSFYLQGFGIQPIVPENVGGQALSPQFSQLLDALGGQDSGFGAVLDADGNPVMYSEALGDFLFLGDVGTRPYPGGEAQLLIDAQKIIDRFDPRPYGPGDRGTRDLLEEGVRYYDPNDGSGDYAREEDGTYKRKALTLDQAKRMAQRLVKYRHPPGTPLGDALAAARYVDSDGGLSPLYKYTEDKTTFAGGMWDQLGPMSKRNALQPVDISHGLFNPNRLEQQLMYAQAKRELSHPMSGLPSAIVNDTYQFQTQVSLRYKEIKAARRLALYEKHVAVNGKFILNKYTRGLMDGSMPFQSIEQSRGRTSEEAEIAHVNAAYLAFGRRKIDEVSTPWAVGWRNLKPRRFAETDAEYEKRMAQRPDSVLLFAKDGTPRAYTTVTSKQGFDNLIRLGIPAHQIRMNPNITPAHLRKPLQPARMPEKWISIPNPDGTVRRSPDGKIFRLTPRQILAQGRGGPLRGMSGWEKAKWIRAAEQAQIAANPYHPQNQRAYKERQKREKAAAAKRDLLMGKKKPKAFSSKTLRNRRRGIYWSDNKKMIVVESYAATRARLFPKTYTPLKFGGTPKHSSTAETARRGY